MIYGSGTLASIGTNTALGTWTVTFNNNTNVTMTVPGGASTNFNIPDSHRSNHRPFCQWRRSLFRRAGGQHRRHERPYRRL